MAVVVGKVVPRSELSIAVEPSLRGSLARLANDRVLVIDYFASRRCSVVIGDLTVTLGDRPTGPGYVELARIEGVRVFAEARLLPVLGDAAATLRLGGPPFARHLAIEIDHPERWLDFLEQPGVLAGKRALRMRRP
jgi:hypothetical protein